MGRTGKSLWAGPAGGAGVRAIRELAAFRYELRRFLRFSEGAAKRHGVTPQQHQLLLGVAGFTGGGRATISDLAEFLQERHHAVSELADRCVKRGLVRKAHDTADRRVVFVTLTAEGRTILGKLSQLHRSQVRELREGLLRVDRMAAVRKAQGERDEQGRRNRGGR